MYRKFCFLLLLIPGILSANTTNTKSLKASRPFPDGFLFGTATAAYQIEGAWNISGKGENIWDRFTHEHPDKIRDRSNGDIACDSYHKFREDVALMKRLGIQFYRFSLSWSRILPKGLAYKINPDGIRYYNQLIDLLLENGIKPMVTLFHWDTPQPLEDLGGFTNERSVKWFEDYARVAFENFGARVPLWLTFNEPKQTCYEGYGGTNKAPAYNSAGIGDYLCTHNVLKAHAQVYHLYNYFYKPTQKGKISITLDTSWYEPKTASDADKEASERMLQFMFGWFADPIFHPNGDYPATVREFVDKRSEKEGFPRSRLPKFTQEEIEIIKGTFDYLGLNHYTTNYVENFEEPIGTPSLLKDARVKTSFDDAWPESGSDWLKVVPWGFTNLLEWINNRYGPDLDIYITENGYSDHGEILDRLRIKYYKEYLAAMLDAMDRGVKVKAYAAWSLLDNFEWLDGYDNRFGLIHVDFEDPNRRRILKDSYEFYKDVIANNALPPEPQPEPEPEPEP